MKTIDDLLVGSLYEGASIHHAVKDEKGKFLGYKSNLAQINLMKHAKSNAALALQLQKAVEALEICIKAMNGMNNEKDLDVVAFDKWHCCAHNHAEEALKAIREAQATVEAGK